ncbi:hypothetical protein [Actinoalloteichus caeruleus]|uniref:hypothetical protein n=1 Tax=Actinoalloteichus cyanogriseus TaxID=2893586 RepID=UPI003558D1BE
MEDHVPEVAQHKRLGHRRRGIAGRYSHVTQDMVDQMCDSLQRRWERASTGSVEPCFPNTYRDQDRSNIICSQNAPTTQKTPPTKIVDGASDHHV